MDDKDKDKESLVDENSVIIPDEPTDEVSLSENDTNVGEVQIVNLYNEHDNQLIDEFNKNIISNLEAKLDYDKTEVSVGWLDIMEETIRYIDNILRNPNRFIVNEEDIVKIELARRVTVESIKHLSRNTNLIQQYDKETGDIKPSKILNINKEESYDTYENRFVYSLIQNMRSYVNFKKKALEAVTVAKDDKRLKYSATSKIKNTKYNMELMLDSSLDADSEDNIAEKALERIAKLENRITDLTSSEVYKTINKLHITLVTSPIKKTNVILKNTNFQYALRLWNYMQEHMDSDMENVSETKEEKVEGKIKDYSDEIFLLEYLILDSYSGEKARSTIERKKEVSKKIINSMLQKLLEMDAVDKKEILELIDKYYTVVKYKNVVNDKEIHDKFKIAIKNYTEKFDSLDLE
ncbi:MAG: DUF2357 domain-containing protein [Bacilli bacterium]|nr:DUF2357 domain-containing protein [Bacilli bacterium]